MIATNCDRLEVYVGGRHVATGAPDRARFGNLAYPPVFVNLTVTDGVARPDLRIDGYVGGRLAGTLAMSADPATDRLAVTVDDGTLLADGSDATRLVFRAVDAHGNHRPHVPGDVRLTVTGPAMLVGDNPFAFGAYGGVGGAWLRTRPGRVGDVTATAEHATLGSGTARLTVVAPAADQHLI
jgi:beta-galactosidase